MYTRPRIHYNFTVYFQHKPVSHVRKRLQTKTKEPKLFKYNKALKKALNPAKYQFPRNTVRLPKVWVIFGWTWQLFLKSTHIANNDKVIDFELYTYQVTSQRTADVVLAAKWYYLNIDCGASAISSEYLSIGIGNQKKLWRILIQFYETYTIAIKTDFGHCCCWVQPSLLTQFSMVLGKSHTTYGSWRKLCRRPNSLLNVRRFSFQFSAKIYIQ